MTQDPPVILPRYDIPQIAFYPNDQVAYNGFVFFCTADNTADCKTTNPTEIGQTAWTLNDRYLCTEAIKP